MVPSDAERVVELVGSIEKLDSIEELIRIAAAPTKS
jgi:hypothetical protein